MFEVHQSTIKTWRRCKRAYYYRYILRLVKRVTGSPLRRGTLAHQMIEDHANGKSPWKALRKFRREYNRMFQEEKEEYGNLPLVTARLMAGYFRWYKEDYLEPVSPTGSGPSSRPA